MKTLPPEKDRVRRHTSEKTNQAIDEKIAARVMRFAKAPPKAISARIDELDAEWDIERVLETNASALALTGVALAATVSRKWLILPGVVLGFLLLHATEGWCPPLPVLRRAGVRTRREIDREKYALKYLCGDFENLNPLH